MDLDNRSASFNNPNCNSAIIQDGLMGMIITAVIFKNLSFLAAVLHNIETVTINS